MKVLMGNYLDHYMAILLLLILEGKLNFFNYLV